MIVLLILYLIFLLPANPILAERLPDSIEKIAQEIKSIDEEYVVKEYFSEEVICLSTDSTKLALPESINIIPSKRKIPRSIYSMPYSMTGNSFDWHRLWINTSVLSGAFVGTLFVLECLPEDATSWNRAEIQDIPLFKRWHDNVLKKGVNWDTDKFYFNYILHPYAGAVYFMTARSCGFNFWRSLLYCSIISNIGWEFGIEAFMERPSVQDLLITPIVGSIIGEGFYHVKRWLVRNDYELLGSKVLGGILAFLVDPVNELTGLWLGNPARSIAKSNAKKKCGVGFSMTPEIRKNSVGLSLAGYF